VRALQRADADRVATTLRGLLGQGDTLDARVIVLLATPDLEDDADSLLRRGVQLLLSPTDEPADRMALAAALRRLNRETELATMIADHGERILEAYESTVYWLLAELCRDQAVDESTANELISVLYALATRKPGPHMVAALEQLLPAVLPADPAAKGSLVEPLGELVVRFRDVRSLDLIRDVLVRMDEAAITPLWSLLEEHAHVRVRRLAAGLLPDLLADAPREEIRDAIERLTAAAHRGTEREEKGFCLEAAARLAQSPSLEDSAPSVAVDQAASGLGDQALAVWGHIAGGPYVEPGRRSEILELLLVGVTADLPDLPAEELVDPNTQDTTYVLDARLGSHTYSVPVMLESLRQIGTSTHLPPPLLRRMVSELTRQWKRVSSWEVIWGPGNIQDLGATLGYLAQQTDFPSSLRLQVAESLLPRVTQLSIAGNLAMVFSSDSGPALANLAGRAALALVQATARGEFADDERGELADVLVSFLLIEDFGDDDAVIRRRVAGLLSTYRTHIALRSRERLKARLSSMPEEIATRLGWLEDQ